jgi:hypothetical protein
MEQLSLDDQVEWDEEEEHCIICEHADDAGSAMGYIKKLDTAMGGRATDFEVANTMVESYDTFFYQPAIQQGETPPILTKEMLTLHFTRHDINPLRQMRKDMNRMNSLQDRLAGNPKEWANLQKLKMDLIQKYDMCDRHTSRDMPSLT